MSDIDLILLVEDEFVIAMHESIQLRKAGYDVIIASCGAEAIAKASLPQLGLILMDVNLGKGINGLQAAREILSVRDIPILFLSSYSEPEIQDMVNKINCCGYVLKNSGFPVLDSYIRMVLNRQSVQNRVPQLRTDISGTA